MTEKYNLKTILIFYIFKFVVGDGAVGKTCLLLSYTTNKFPTDYIPTVFENYSTLITINDEQYTLSLWDTAGQETYDQVRLLSYDSTNIFLITFSVVDDVTFDNAMKKWLPEIRNTAGGQYVIVFVGNKIDMRTDSLKHIQKQAATQLLQNEGIEYFEVSAMTQEGLKEAFDQAIKLHLKKSSSMTASQKQSQAKKKKGFCSLI
ncbi:hypothetical protein pb186bvf_005255 [Paramecium bursaria]